MSIGRMQEFSSAAASTESATASCPLSSPAVVQAADPRRQLRIPAPARYRRSA